MEDVHIALPDFTPECGLFAVLDGHGGIGVARVVARILPGILLNQKSFSSEPPDYADAFTQAFHDVDEYLLSAQGGLDVYRMDHPVEAVVCDQELQFEQLPAEAAYRAKHMGCTCVASLIFSHKVIVANIGDSRCVLSAIHRSRNGTPSMIMRSLSTDHKPSNEEERIRIIAAGGRVMRDSIGGERINGGLNVSRGFGDFAYKEPNKQPKECLVSIVPEIQEYPLVNVDHICITLCCDGIWERNSSIQVSEFIQAHLCANEQEEAPHDLVDIASSLIDKSTCTMEERVSMDPSVRFTGQDNMTVVLVRVCR